MLAQIEGCLAFCWVGARRWFGKKLRGDGGWARLVDRWSCCTVAMGWAAVCSARWRLESAMGSGGLARLAESVRRRNE
ncbi:hypothetical protein TIFTF001_043322 [Ficus carica]|uniref:Uncharacterized protein n=1 Tax=Ficus carica TaxID=3494 RepID=A0AA87ZB91_FICCA|nr:hypothetical protein TIFTF001_043317 [Ficus carica]GMN21471.1 hypothetical protein TIFTF001_043322 [Ficus carica]